MTSKLYILQSCQSVNADMWFLYISVFKINALLKDVFGSL